MIASTEIVIATRNAGKVREIAKLLDSPSICLRSLGDFSSNLEVNETGATFAANAELKARFYAGKTRTTCLADDSGLEVAALGGAPGVYSARYGGSVATDAERIAQLLTELDTTTDPERLARFVCVMAIAEPEDNKIRFFTGECRGRIARTPRGANGFGYDPVFIPDGYRETFAELPLQVKNSISHRAKALRAVRLFLCGENDLESAKLVSD